MFGVGGGVGRELLGRVARHEATVVDDADAVAQVLGLVHRVGREHDGRPSVAQLAAHRPRRVARQHVIFARL